MHVVLTLHLLNDYVALLRCAGAGQCRGTNSTWR